MSQSWGNKVVDGMFKASSPSKIEGYPQSVASAEGGSMRGVAVGRGSMTGDGIIPPRPFGALPLSQGESLVGHPRFCDITYPYLPSQPSFTLLHLLHDLHVLHGLTILQVILIYIPVRSAGGGLTANC